MVPIAFAGAGAVLVVVAVAGLELLTDDPVAERFENTRRVRGARRRERTNPLTVIIDAVGTLVGPLVLQLVGDSQKERWESLLDSAGRPHGLTATTLANRKGGYALLMAAAGVLFALNGNWWFVPALAVVGFFLPDIALRSEAAERQEEITRRLPDFLDVLTVTVSAGLDFRSALERVAAAFDGPLSEEVRTALRQMMLGESRRNALEALRRRNDSEPLGEFVTALQQAEDLGAPLTTALGDISEDVRQTYGQEARQKASKVEPRLSVILTVTLIPAAIIILGVGFYLTSDFELGGLLGG